MSELSFLIEGRLLLRTPGLVPLRLAYVLLVETNPFSELVVIFRTMLFEYPSLLSRFSFLKRPCCPQMTFSETAELNLRKLDGKKELKAILRLYIYKALYDQSYLGSKTTMSTGEWSCLIAFEWDPLTCSERRGGVKNSK